MQTCLHTYSTTDAMHTHTHTLIHTQRRIHTCIRPLTHHIHMDVSVAEWLAWLTSNCGRIGAIGSSPSNGLRPNMWGQKGFNPLCQCVYIYVCIVKPDIQTIHRCSHTSIHTYTHIHANRQTLHSIAYLYTYLPTSLHSCIYIHIHTCSYIHTYIYTYVHADTHRNIHTHKYNTTLAVCTRTHAHTHTHTHTHTQHVFEQRRYNLLCTYKTKIVWYILLILFKKLIFHPQEDVCRWWGR